MEDSSKTRYRLIRTLPDGNEKAMSPRGTKRDAAMQAARILHDNGRATKEQAQRFSPLLTRVALGVTVEAPCTCPNGQTAPPLGTTPHADKCAYGYRFRIVTDGGE